MPPSRRIELTDEEDEKLREVEQDPHLRNKVRLRAQVLRLSGRGSNMSQIASYTGRRPTSIEPATSIGGASGAWRDSPTARLLETLRA